MKFLQSIPWNEVFDGWRAGEASNPGWIHCATEVKGWPDWEHWRRFTEQQIGAGGREWSLHRIDEAFTEIPRLLLGPYGGWQSRVPQRNVYSFEQLLEIPEQYEYFAHHGSVQLIRDHLPFPTQFIGLVRQDGAIVCIEGHHRATAIALARRQHFDIRFDTVEITIALASLGGDESELLDRVLERGTHYQPHE